MLFFSLKKKERKRRRFRAKTKKKKKKKKKNERIFGWKRGREPKLLGFNLEMNIFLWIFFDLYFFLMSLLNL